MLGRSRERPVMWIWLRTAWWPWSSRIAFFQPCSHDPGQTVRASKTMSKPAVRALAVKCSQATCLSPSSPRISSFSRLMRALVRFIMTCAVGCTWPAYSRRGHSGTAHDHTACGDGAVRSHHCTAASTECSSAVVRNCSDCSSDSIWSLSCTFEVDSEGGVPVGLVRV